MTRVRQNSLRQGRPIWLSGQSAHPRSSYLPLTGTEEADVVIVGGGMTGALTALEFAQAGVAAVVLEAAHVGRGSTAASSALLLQEPDRGMAELAERYGRAASVRIWQLSRDAVGDFVKMIRRLRTRCGMVKRDAVYYATTAEAVERLREEFRLRTRAGFNEEWLSPAALRRLTAIAGRGAIRTSGNAEFDPYAACLGVMRAAHAAGAQVFERSPVTRIAQRRGRVRVHTASGTVDARRVIIATGYATARFRPLAGRFRMYRTYVLATPPLRAHQRREVGLGDVMAWDTERPYPICAGRRIGDSCSAAATDEFAAVNLAIGSSPSRRNSFGESSRACFRRWQTSASKARGKVCSRRRPTASPTSARISAIPGICSRSGTAATV